MMTPTGSERSPNPVDIHVGARIRMRRKALGISQERLADSLGLTFQQVQKYERGANRVSASKLYDIARRLKTSVAYFFDGLADPMQDQPGVGESGSTEFVHDLVMTPEGMELAALFPKIKRRRTRRAVLDLVKSLTDEGAEA
jgi:DNA-binding XRE family transcriptional regulator